MASSISQASYKHLYLSFLLLTIICVFYFFQIWGRIRYSSLCLFVLSTPVFLLTLCCFIGEERNKKKKSLPLLSQNLSKLLPITVFLHAPVCSFRLSSCQAPSSSWTCGASLTIPAKSYCCGCCQQASEDFVRATPRASRWLSLWETPGSSSSLVALRMCLGICVPRFLTVRTIW